ncbi:MAG: MFS transporter [bacterium]|nr:MFS transporter [bacterium]
MAYRRNIKIYHLLNIASAAAFINGNWIFLWLRVMTFGQLGVVDATAFAFGLFMEVPTGGLSDMLGKRWTLILSMFLNGLGFFIMGAATSIWGIVVGFWFTQTAWAFYSGAADAMAYDSLKTIGEESRYDKVSSFTNSISVFTVGACALIGGWMYNIDARLPHYAWGFVLFMGFFIALGIKEPPIDTVKFTVKNYLNQLSQGFKQLARPELRYFTPLIFATLGVHYLFTFGLIQPTMATDFGFFADGQAVIFSIMGFASAGTMLLIPLMRKRISDMRGLVLLALLLAGLYFIATTHPNMLIGAVVLILVRSVGGLSSAWASIVVNREIPSEYRATTLSTVALLSKIPYIVTAVIAGALAENGQFSLFYWGVILFLIGIVVSVTVAYRVYRKPLTHPATSPTP